MNLRPPTVLVFATERFRLLLEASDSIMERTLRETKCFSYFPFAGLFVIVTESCSSRSSEIPQEATAVETLVRVVVQKGVQKA